MDDRLIGKKNDSLKFKDERKANTNIEAIITTVGQCKTHLETLLDKLGPNEANLVTNSLDWPTILASFSIISSDMISINKLLKEKSCKDLKNCVFVPRLFSEDIDPNLQEITQNRMSIFNNDLIPHILRTKPLPELEEKEIQIIRLSKDLEQRGKGEKNITQVQKRLKESCDTIDARRAESSNQLIHVNQVTYAPNDTFTLAKLFITTSNRQRNMPQTFSPMPNR